MKKKDALISVAIIVAASLTLWVCLRSKGHVRIDAGGASAELQVQNGWFAGTTIASGDGTTQVGARLYNARCLSISTRQNGQAWQIESLGPFGDLSRIKVRRNQTTELRIGPPFAVRPDVSRNGSALSIGYSIIGQAGERYRNFATCDGRATPGAKISILDEAGNVLETGQFSYG